MAQATALAEQAKTIGDQNATIMEMLDRLSPEGDDDTAPHGRDMAGKPIKVS